MDKTDTYLTLEEAAEGEFRDRGSKFLAYAYPAYSEEDWQERLEEVKKAHSKARHHCYAFRIGQDKNNFRANDDGEPSGTAGRPILGQIDRYQLSNVVIIVVRYFGGTKLGTSGLINAYKTSAADALESASIIEKKVEEVYQITFEYVHMSNVMGVVKPSEAEIIEQDFGNIGKLTIAIRQSEITAVLNQIKARVAQVRIEEVEKVESIPGFEMEYLYTR